MYEESDWVLVDDDLRRRQKIRPCLGSNALCVPTCTSCGRMRVLWGWSLAACQVSLWVWGPRHGESGSTSRPGPEPESSSLLHLEFNTIWMLELLYLCTFTCTQSTRLVGQMKLHSAFTKHLTWFWNHDLLCFKCFSDKRRHRFGFFHSTVKGNAL